MNGVRSLQSLVGWFRPCHRNPRDANLRMILPVVISFVWLLKEKKMVYICWREMKLGHGSVGVTVVLKKKRWSSLGGMRWGRSRRRKRCCMMMWRVRWLTPCWHDPVQVTAQHKEPTCPPSSILHPTILNPPHVPSHTLHYYLETVRFVRHLEWRESMHSLQVIRSSQITP